ncbi:MAG: hypothetical protein N2C14_11795, partial [Planctomycetales bacterium]
MSENNQLRKAAILVSCLDDPAATRILVQLDPSLRSRVRQAALELGDLDPDEQSRVGAEIFRDCSRDSPTPAKPNRLPPDEISTGSNRQPPV